MTGSAWGPGEIPVDACHGRSTQLQFAFLEVPKYAAGDNPVTLIDKWAYFFRQAADLTLVPEALSAPPLTGPLDAARSAGFTEEEWDATIREGLALQVERGTLSLALQQGEEKGLRDGKTAALREMLDTLVRARFGEVPPGLVARVASAGSAELQRWVTHFATATSLDDVFREG